MASYTINGYLALLQLRTSKTLLVEGPSDKKSIGALIHRMREAGKFTQESITVDTAASIQAGGLGNRQLVEHIYALAHATSPEFSVLVDREFREFSVGPPIADLAPGHGVMGPSAFWTRGHSIENYYFSGVYFTGFLSFAFPDSLPAQCLVEIQRQFPSLLQWAAAIGLAANNHKVISKLNGVFGTKSWLSAAAGEFAPNFTQIQAELVARGVAQATTVSFVADAGQYRSDPSLASNLSTVRWICHGHIGMNLLWSGVSKILETQGVPAEVVDTAARGEQEMKIRYLSNKWAEHAIAGADEYPDALVQHLRRA